MRVTSSTFSQMSGKMSGTVATNSKSGTVIRARVKPTNPKTANQTKARVNLAATSTSWGSTLTAAQRAAWNAAAASNPLPNRLGVKRPLSGAQYYARCNGPRIQAGLAAVTTPPSGNGSCPLGTITMTSLVHGSPGIVTLAIAGAPAWAGSATGAIIVEQTAPQPAGRTAPKGGYSVIGFALGNATPITTAVVHNAAIATAALIVFTRVKAIDSAGNVSVKQVIGPTTAT